MFAAMDLGIADDGQRASREQAAQIAITLFADLPVGRPVFFLEAIQGGAESGDRCHFPRSA
jgi:hypothetical protein